MGCTSGKHIKTELKGKNLPQKQESQAQDSNIQKIINTIQILAIELENLYSEILDSNQQIPKEYASLEPSQFLEKIREKGYMFDEEVDQIEAKFKIIFIKISDIMRETSLVLFDRRSNQKISQQNQQFLSTFVLLYEKTCALFFQYSDLRKSKQFFDQVYSKTNIKGTQSDIKQKSISQISTQRTTRGSQ